MEKTDAEYILTMWAQRMGSQTVRRVRTQLGISGSSERETSWEKV